MAIKIDYSLLEEVGLGGLSKEDKDDLLRHFRQQLEQNVGEIISSQLTDEQLSEFEKLIDAKKAQEALKWLKNNYPNYKQVVEQEVKKLKNELKSRADDIKSNLE